MKFLSLIICIVIISSLPSAGRQMNQFTDDLSGQTEFQSISSLTDPKEALNKINLEQQKLLNPFGSLQNEKSDSVYKPYRITLDNALRYTYTYNDAGKILVKLTETGNNGSWENLMREVNTFDSRNNHLLCMKESWVSGKWVSTGKDTLIYNDKGLLSYKLSELYAGSTLISRIRYTAEYNPQDLVKRYTTEKWVNNSWDKVERYSYSYDQYKYPSLVLKEIPKSNGGWVGETRMTYGNDSYGRKTLIRKEDSLGFTWVPDYEWSYLYDNMGNVTNSSLSNKVLPYYYFMKVAAWEYQYDSKNNNTYTLKQTLDQNELVPQSRTTATYSGKRQLSTLTETYTRPNWLKYSKTSTTYNDSAGFRIWNYYFYSNGVYDNLQRDSILYDSKDRILVNIHKENQPGGLKNINRFEYAYNNKDHISASRYFSWQDPQGWTPATNIHWICFNNNKESISFSAASVEVEYTALTGVEKEGITGIEGYSLSQNYPNPFNPSTTIKYSIMKEGNVRLTVYDILGNRVAQLVNENKPAGTYTVKFNGSHLSSGIYIYRLESAGYSDVKKLMLIK